MLLRKLSQSFKVSLALLFAVTSTGILSTSTANAMWTGGGEGDCSLGYILLEKYEEADGGYALEPESDGSTVSASITATSGSFTVTDADYVVNEVVVSGGGFVDRDPYPLGTTSGTFNNSALTTGIPNRGGQVIYHDISNVQFCGSLMPTTPTGTLNVSTDCEEITFSAGAITPTGGTITFTLDGATKDAGTYTVTPGEHTVVMSVNGTIVDTETRIITECQNTTPTGTLNVSTDCEEITFGAATASPEGATVTFTLNGEAKDADTYSVNAGEYTVIMFVNDVEVDREIVEVGECVIPPTGTLGVRVNCESITFRATAVEPSRATVTFELNGVEVEDGQHVVPAGEYTIDLYVNGTKVDTETRTVTECEPDKKTELCHATHSETNPYELIDVSVSAAFHGHLGDGNGDHQDGEDIIPPFQYRGNTYSQNWPSGQDIFENGCVEPDDEVPTADIEATVICVANGVRVTLTNSGGANGTATVNGEEYDVPANDTTEVTLDFDLGTPFKTAVKVMVGESTLIDRIVSCGNLLGTTDVCPNIEGTQTVVPAGLIRNPTTGECFTPGGRGAFTPAQVLGAATALPETLPSTGSADSPLAIIIASILAYGAAYFLQGRRLLGRKEALSA